MTDSSIEGGYGSILSPEAIADGFTITADDHVLELRKDGKVIARFSQTGVELTNILTEIETYRN